MVSRGVIGLCLGLAVLMMACAPAAAPTPTPAPKPPAATPAPTPKAAPAASPTPGLPAVRATGPSMQLKVASQSPEADISSQTIKFWGDLVTKLTAGRITFQYFWAGSLLTQAQMFEGVRDGLADIGNVPTTSISGKIIDVAVLEVPFAYPLDDESIIKFHAEVNPIIDGLYEKFTQKLVWTNPAIVGDPVTCKDKFLYSPATWKGALVRTAGRWQSETLKLWGANPVFIDLGDLYASLQRGTVDCTLLVYNLLDSFRIYEVVKNITRIDHSINYSTIPINLSVWKKLPPEDQQIFIEAGKEAQKKALELRKDTTVQAIEKFKGQGVKFCTPTTAELRRLREISEQVWEMIKKEQGPAGQQIMTIAAKYRDKVVTGPTEGDLTPCPSP